MSGYGNLREFRLRSQEEDVNKAFLEGMVFTGESEAIAKINDINPRETRLNNELCVIFRNKQSSGSLVKMFNVS